MKAKLVAEYLLASLLMLTLAMGDLWQSAEPSQLMLPLKAEGFWSVLQQ